MLKLAYVSCCEVTRRYSMISSKEEQNDQRSHYWCHEGLVPHFSTTICEILAKNQIKNARLRISAIKAPKIDAPEKHSVTSLFKAGNIDHKLDVILT